VAAVEILRKGTGPGRGMEMSTETSHVPKIDTGSDQMGLRRLNGDEHGVRGLGHARKLRRLQQSVRRVRPVPVVVVDPPVASDIRSTGWSKTSPPSLLVRCACFSSRFSRSTFRTGFRRSGLTIVENDVFAYTRARVYFSCYGFVESVRDTFSFRLSPRTDVTILRYVRPFDSVKRVRFAARTVTNTTPFLASAKNDFRYVRLKCRGSVQSLATERVDCFRTPRGIIRHYGRKETNEYECRCISVGILK